MWLYSSKFKTYLQTKFRRYISIYGWDITTSALEKQTSAILEFFFTLLLRPYHSNRRAIPHATKFCPYRLTRGGVMTSYTISRWRQRWLNTTSGFVCNDVTFIRSSKCIRKRKLISSPYLNPQLRYNYFWFEKKQTYAKTKYGVRFHLPHMDHVISRIFLNFKVTPCWIYQKRCEIVTMNY